MPIFFSSTSASANNALYTYTSHAAGWLCYLMLASDCPTYLSSISGPCIILGSLACNILPISRAISVLPVPVCRGNIMCVMSNGSPYQEDHTAGSHEHGSYLKKTEGGREGGREEGREGGREGEREGGSEGGTEKRESRFQTS